MSAVRGSSGAQPVPLEVALDTLRPSRNGTSLPLSNSLMGSRTPDSKLAPSRSIPSRSFPGSQAARAALSPGGAIDSRSSGQHGHSTATARRGAGIWAHSCGRLAMNTGRPRTPESQLRGNGSRGRRGVREEHDRTPADRAKDGE